MFMLTRDKPNYWPSWQHWKRVIGPLRVERENKGCVRKLIASEPLKVSAVAAAPSSTSLSRARTHTLTVLIWAARLTVSTNLTVRRLH